jgi:hypothetical protein
MKCAIPRAWEVQRSRAITRTGMTASRRVLVAMAALLTTGLWAAIIGAVCWAAGISMMEYWFAALMGVIFVLALLGLSLAASLGDETELPGDAEDTRAVETPPAPQQEESGIEAMQEQHGLARSSEPNLV